MFSKKSDITQIAYNIGSFQKQVAKKIESLRHDLYQF